MNNDQLEKNLRLLEESQWFGFSHLAQSVIELLGPGGVFLYFALLFLGMGSLFFLAVRCYRVGPGQRLFSDRAYLALASVLVIWGRWPHFVSREYNPDESTVLAGADAFLRKPVPFVGYDITTIGPFQVLPMAFGKGLFGLTLDFGLGRFVGLLACVATLILLFLVGRKLTGESWSARATLLVGTLYESLTTLGDLVAFSTEMIPMMCLMFMIFVACEADGLKVGEIWRAAVIGLVGSSMAYWKLQLAPPAAFIGIAYLLWVRMRGQRTVPATSACLGSALVLQLLLVVWVTSFGGWNDFWIGYIQGNLVYSEKVRVLQPYLVGFMDSSADPLWARAARTWNILFFQVPELRSFLRSGTVAIFLLSLNLARNNRAALTSSRPLHLAALFFTLCLTVIILPGNAYSHYARIALAPGLLLLTLLLSSGGKKKGSGVFYLATFLILSVPFIYERFTPLETPHLRGYPEQYFQLGIDFGIPREPIVVDTLRFAQVGDPVAVWGWAPKIFTSGQLTPGTRQVIGERVIEPRFDLEFYRRRYLEDFTKYQPTVMVDAIGHFMYDKRELFGWETFPELKAIIDRDYYLALDRGRYRIYVRRSLRK